MNPSLWILSPPAYFFVACIGYAAARARREPVVGGKILKEELRLIVGSAALVLVVAYVWQQGRVLGDLLALLVGPGLARILGEELGNAALCRRRRAAGGAGGSDAQGGPAPP